MARARNIKPGFFKNELLVELPFEYRLLFIGLWTMADRDGRLEDKPTKIRMEIFPADAVDVEDGLQRLHDSEFVQRYQVGGKRYVQILAWAKHQNPHKKEVASTIPAPEEKQSPVITGPAPAIPGQATTKAIASPADSLIPDSLIPDSVERAEPRAATTAVEAWQTIRQFAGYAPGQCGNAADPRLQAAVDAGVAVAEFAAVAHEASTHDPPKPFGWVIATAHGRHRDATKPGANHANRPQRSRVGLADRHPRPAARDDYDGDAIPGAAVRIHG